MKNKPTKRRKGILGLVVASAILIAGFACTKQQVDTFTTIGFNYTYEVSIPDTTISETQPAEGKYVSPEIDTKWTETIKNAKSSADLVSEIKMTRLSVTCMDGTANLDYVKNIKIYIKSANNAEVLLTMKDSIPAGAYALNMDLKDLNLKNYIFEDKIQFRTDITFKPASIIFAQKLRMDASLLGSAKVSGLK